MEKELIFISSPYSHQDKAITLLRYEETLKYAAYLMNNKQYCFSPVIHCHELAEKHALPGDWGYWQHYCELTLGLCQSMNILALDGWRESSGVEGEIKTAQELALPILIVNPHDYSEQKLQFVR